MYYPLSTVKVSDHFELHLLIAERHSVRLLILQHICIMDNIVHVLYYPCLHMRNFGTFRHVSSGTWTNPIPIAEISPISLGTIAHPLRILLGGLSYKLILIPCLHNQNTYSCVPSTTDVRRHVFRHAVVHTDFGASDSVESQRMVVRENKIIN